MREEDRPRGVELDGDRDEGEGGKENDETECGTEDVDRSLDAAKNERCFARGEGVLSLIVLVNECDAGRRPAQVSLSFLPRNYLLGGPARLCPGSRPWGHR